MGLQSGEPQQSDKNHPSLNAGPTVQAAVPNRIISIIQKRPDFLAANRGKRFVTPGFVLLVHKRRTDHPVAPETVRVGYTVTKKIGNAVIRNRMKRRFRAMADRILPEYGISGADHIIIGRKSNMEPDFAAMSKDLEKGLAHLARKFG